MMDGAVVADSSRLSRDSPRLCAVVSSHIDFVKGFDGGRVGCGAGLLWALLATYTPNCLFHFEASRNVIAR